MIGFVEHVYDHWRHAIAIESTKVLSSWISLSVEHPKPIENDDKVSFFEPMSMRSLHSILRMFRAEMRFQSETIVVGLSNYSRFLAFPVPAKNFAADQINR